MALKIYLAGPDVFLPNAKEVGETKCAMCAEFGYEGLFPLDSDVDSGDPAAIFRANCASMRRADIGLFNLTPFRGPSADVGTAFELGFMFSQEPRPRLFGYTNEAASYRERVRDDGLGVEDFGLSDNLMLVLALESVAAQPDPRSEGVEALGAFRACLENVRRATTNA